MIAQALLASTAIVLLSFISEDAATISSSLSLFGGPITWPLGFAACFAGIWLGDLGLYSLARCFGKPILKSRWIARFADATAIERCQIKFNQSRFAHVACEPVRTRNPLADLPGGRTALNARYEICGSHGLRRARVDRRHFHHRKAPRLANADLVVFRPHQDCRRSSYSSRSWHRVACVQETHPRASLGEALGTLGILAGVAVLHSGGRLLCVARDSPSRPECADFGKSRNRDRWLHRGIEAGDARSTSP